MALFDPSCGPAATVTIQQARFPDLRANRAFRRTLAERFDRLDGLVFAKNMRALASHGGFGGWPGDPRRSITLCAWQSEDSARSYLASELGHAGGSNWSVLLEVLSTRGDHRGAAPLTSSGARRADGPLAVLTLGTTCWRSLLRFMIFGSRMRKQLEGSPGLLFATSAGWPTTGNSTFSVWDDEESMQRFAYGASGRHVSTAHSRRPVLNGQLNARMRVIEMSGSLELSRSGRSAPPR